MKALRTKKAQLNQGIRITIIILNFSTLLNFILEKYCIPDNYYPEQVNIIN